MVDINALLELNGGVILARDYRSLRSTLSRGVRDGWLARPMRGVYTRPEPGLALKAKAVIKKIPDAVVVGNAALALNLQGYPMPEVVEVCTPTHHRPQPGFSFTERRVPVGNAREGVMLPVVAAVDVCNTTCDGLDMLMREQAVDPHRFEKVANRFPKRRGNKSRRKQIKRSMTRPWSAAERGYHDLFERRHIKGWTANGKLKLWDKCYITDILFRKEKLAIEIDGRQYHSSKEAFEEDRRRQNDLVRAGWTVLRFTWAMLDEPDMVIKVVKATLARLHH